MLTWQVSQELGRLAEKLPLCMELRPKAVIDIRAGNKRKTMLITTGARMPVLKAVSGSGVAFDVSLTTMAGPQIAAYMRQQVGGMYAVALVSSDKERACFIWFHICLMRPSQVHHVFNQHVFC